METSQSCPGGFQYSVATSKTNSRTQYCQGGSVTRLDLPNKSVVSLQVKPKAQVEPVLFQASVLSKKKTLNINNTFKKGCINC